MKGVPGCSEYVDKFSQEEIDGQALGLLTLDHLMSTPMSMMLGPALKICTAVDAMRQVNLCSLLSRDTSV